ncbi:MAG: hypothetical protein KatS3mg027_1994 [Bacteroidia bacterium]|nr:MAG: hypothetical protein KatS3mg027_1994 [Bacteroidia bacterium]
MSQNNSTLKFSIIKLKFIEPIALSSERDDDYIKDVNSIPSDTLKAALISAFAEVSTNQIEINEFNEHLIVSSAFPFINDLYFFPKPQLSIQNYIEKSQNQNQNQNDFELKYRKKLKKVKFIEKNVLEKIISGTKLYFDEIINFNDFESIALKSPISSNTNYPSKIYVSETIERVSLGCKPYLDIPHSEKGDPYYFTRTHFFQSDKYSTGLWFAWQSNQADVIKINDCLLNALELLKNNGIGADKSIGHGKFEFEVATIELNYPSDFSHIINLSKFLPSEKEFQNISLENSMYNLSLCGGYIAGSSDHSKRHWIRKYVWMFDEGSILKFNNQSETEKIIFGKNVIALNSSSLPHQVFRDGRSIFLPIKLS